MSAPIDRWILTRHRLKDDALGVVVLWAGFAAFVFAVVFIVAIFRPIEVSGWEIASQLPRWYIAGLGVYLAAVYLPLYVAHGFTRHEIARQLPASAAITVVVLSALMTLGFAIEGGVYRLVGWPQELTRPHLFDDASSYPLMFVEFWLLFTVWLVAGTFVGAAIYRSPVNGLFAIPVGLAMIGLAEAVLSPGVVDILGSAVGFLGFAPDGASVAGSLAVVTGCLAVGLPATWLLVRDMPLRSERT